MWYFSHLLNPSHNKQHCYWQECASRISQRLLLDQTNSSSNWSRILRHPATFRVSPPFSLLSLRLIRDTTANPTSQTLHLETSFLKSLCASVVLQGNVTFSCTQPQLVACTFLSSASSFLSLPSAPSPATGGFSLRFQFRTWNPEGLLLSTQLHPPPQRLELRISNSRLSLTLHNSGRQKSEVSAGEFAMESTQRLSRTRLRAQNVLWLLNAVPLNDGDLN